MLYTKMKLLLSIVIATLGITNIQAGPSSSLAEAKVDAAKTMSETGPKLNHSNKRSANKQSIRCYEYSDLQGDGVTASDYVDDFKNYNFNNRITSCCFTGIWLLYEDSSYNANNVEAMSWWAFGDNYCTNVPTEFDNTASSLRFTGAPDDMRYDTLNLYFNDYFTGQEEFTYVDRPALNYDNRAKSVIVTGCKPWTLYKYDNYQGTAICVFPSDTTKCDPGFYPRSQSLGNMTGQVSSVRRGCHVNTKVWPDNSGAGEGMVWTAGRDFPANPRK